MSKKLLELKKWASENITLINLLPTNTGLKVTTRLIDVLEDEVDEKYYLSEEKTKKLTLDNDLSGKLNHFNYDEMDRIYSIEKLSPTLNTMQGGNKQPKIAVKGFKEIVKVRKYEVNKLELSELLRIGKQDARISNKEISNTLNVPVTKVEHWFRSDKSFSIPDADIWFELKKILNITNTDHDDAITTFEEKESGFDTTNRVYDVEHLSPTLNTTSEPKVAVLGNTSNTGYRSHDVHDTYGLSPTIAARDYKGPKQVAVPVLTPDRVNKRQNGRRFKEDGEPMFTLTSQDKHGIAVREATKQGYTVAEQGDSVNVSYPTSKTRRGRVGKQVAQTLQAGDVNQGVVMNDIRIRKLTPLECWRLQGFTDEQFYKAKNDGVSNSQLYKQAGNSVTVNVVDAIVKKLKE